MDEKMRARIRDEMLESLNQPMGWPHYPRLPVKRYVKNTDGYDDLETGIIISGYHHTVFLDNLFNFEGKTGYLRDDYLDNKDMKRIVYDSVDEMLKAGWMVD